MGSGKRSLDTEKNKNIKINYKIIVLAILIIALVSIILFFAINTPKKEKQKENNNTDSEVLSYEIPEVEKKTIDQILAEFGGEVTGQPKEDTYYVTKDGVEYTVYLDGEIAQGKIVPWSGESKQPQVDEAGNANIYTAEELKWIADQVVSGERNFSGVTIILRNNIDLGARQKEDGTWEGTPWTSIVGFLDEIPQTNEESNTENTTQENQILDDSIEVKEANLKRFAGVFNGNGFSIRGMNVVSDKDYQGLFGFSSGTITNLKLKYSNVQGNNVVGGIVGLNLGLVQSCYIEHVTIQGKEKVGGFVRMFYDRI